MQAGVWRRSVGAAAVVVCAVLLPGVTTAGTGGASTTRSLTPQPVWVTYAHFTISPILGTSILVGVSCSSTDQCMAVGSSSEGHDVFSPLVQQWDGRSWSPLSAPSGPDFFEDQLNGVSCTATSFCAAVGRVLDQWDGVSWSAASTGQPSLSEDLLGVSCTSATFCMAVGDTSPGSPSATTTLTERWDGATWTVVPSPDEGSGDNSLSGVSCASPVLCLAVGTAVAGTDQSLVEQWNGSAWSIDPSADNGLTQPNSLAAVSCPTTTFCAAVGSASNGEANQGLVEHWNGSTWTIVPSPDTSPSEAYSLGGVSCTSPSACEATGTQFETWDGTAWSFAAAQDAASAPLGISCASVTVCAAVGAGYTIDMRYVPGYWEVAADGGIFSFGDAPYFGSMGGQHLNAPIVAMAATPDHRGYWEVAADGGVFNFGDAEFFGSAGNLALNKPIVGMAATPDGGGYWLVASDGGIFSYGDAQYFGSMGGVRLNEPVVGIIGTPDGNGYWEVASDGGVFNFGDATFFGSMGWTPLNEPVVGIIGTPDGRGYWEVASDGGIFNFGDAYFRGSAGNLALDAPVTGIGANG